MLRFLFINFSLSGHLRLVGGVFLIALGVGLCSLALSAPALAASSATFQVRDDQIGASSFSQTSPNFTVHSSVEPIVGSPASPSFNLQSGVPLQIDSAGVTPPSTPSGGTTTPEPNPNCPAPTNFSVTNLECNRAYKSLIKISGTKDAKTSYIFINNELAGVHLGSNTTWDKDVYLQPGPNTIVVYGKNNCNAQTPPITITLTRARMGDTNDDSQTNDYDLSTFTRRWERREDCITDFNRDLITNDYDLSLLASSWNG